MSLVQFRTWLNFLTLDPNENQYPKPYTLISLKSIQNDPSVLILQRVILRWFLSLLSAKIYTKICNKTQRRNLSPDWFGQVLLSLDQIKDFKFNNLIMHKIINFSGFLSRYKAFNRASPIKRHLNYNIYSFILL